MRKIFVCALALCLLLCGCGRVGDAPTDSADQLAERVRNTLSEREFLLADADFIESNFGTEHLADGVVMLEKSGACECGIFQLTDRAATKGWQAAIERYIEGEKEATSNLAALYPANELEERLSLYKNATIGTEGNVIYYFILKNDETQKALAALGF